MDFWAALIEFTLGYFIDLLSGSLLDGLLSLFGLGA